MKIGLVLSAVPGYSETFFRNKIKFLQEAGLEVVLFVDNNTGGFDACKIYEGFTLNTTKKKKLIILLRTVLRLMLNLKVSLKLWNLNNADGFPKNKNLKSIIGSAHILGKNLDWLHFGFATMAINRENVAGVIGAKMAVSVRGYDVCIYPLKNPGCYNLLWDRIDKLHYISDDLLNEALTLGLDFETPKAKITPAVDIETFKQASNTDKRDKLKDVLKITTVARLHWKKGLDYTLEALAKIADMGINFEYTIIGDGQEYERLKFTSHQLGLTKIVLFKGKLISEEIKNELAKTDIYLQYSIQEGFCNAVLEAQAMGCLCVVSNAEGLSENVLNKKTGFVVEKRKPEVLANKLIEVINMPETDKAAMRKNAVKRVREEFNLDKQKKEFFKFYA